MFCFDFTFKNWQQKNWQQVLFTNTKNKLSMSYFHEFFYGIFLFILFMFFIPFLCLLDARPVAPVSSDPLVTEIGWEDPCCHLQKVKTWKVLFVYNFFCQRRIFTIFLSTVLFCFDFMFKNRVGGSMLSPSKGLKSGKLIRVFHDWLIFQGFFSFFSSNCNSGFSAEVCCWF